MKRLFLLVCLLLPVACSLPQAKPSDVTIYRLSVPVLAPPSGTPPRSVVLVVDPGYMAPEIAGQAIVVQQADLRLNEVAEARWPVPLPAYLKQQLIRGFAAGKGFHLVADAPVGGTVNQRLRFEILDFQIEDHDTNPSPPSVHVRIQAILQRLDEVSPHSETVIIAEARVPAEERRMAAIVRAFDRAFTEVAQRIAEGVFAALPGQQG